MLDKLPVAQYDDEDWTLEQRRYANAVALVDTGVGRILDTLNLLGLGNNTVVFLTADCGPFNGPTTAFFQSAGGLRGGMGQLYEGGIRAPMIVWGPNYVYPGTINANPCAAWDFLPTAADLANTWRRPSFIDGLSFRTWLGAQTQAAHPYFYWESRVGGLQQALRWANWKAIRLNAGGPWALV